MGRSTIQVTTRNRHLELCVLLHSLRHQTYQEFDILLCDDASGQPILGQKFIQDIITRLKLEGHDVQVIRNDFSMGVCRARQQLVDADPWKDNPFIIRLDDDCILEEDYLERLHDLMIAPKHGSLDKPDFEVGIVSGVTPLFGAPPFVRETRFVGPVVNDCVFDKDGNVAKYADDTGLEYDLPKVLFATNFRSMAMFRREIFKDISYQQGLSPVCFREEAFLSMNAILKGWKIMVDLGAVAWHAPCPTGGTRSNPQEYQRNVMMDDEKFRAWMKKMFKEHGDFLEDYRRKVNG